MKDKIVRYGKKSKFKFFTSKFLSVLGICFVSTLLVIPVLLAFGK